MALKDVLAGSWKGMGDDLARSVGLFEPPLAKNKDLAPKQDEEVEREVHLRPNPSHICVDNVFAYCSLLVHRLSPSLLLAGRDKSILRVLS